MSKDRIGALVFLPLFLFYGYTAWHIPLDFFSEQETFNARTLPLAIALTGSVLCSLLLITGDRCTGSSEKLNMGNMIPLGLFLVLMTSYGLTLTLLGFILATTLFLTAGFAILGERRLTMLAAASLLPAGAFWILMHSLGIQLPAGSLFYALFT